jgi:hypothetical protein
VCSILLQAALLSALWCSPARADESWTETGNKNGVVYEKRAVSGSKFLEYRATMQVRITAAQALEGIWKVVTELPPPPSVKSRRVLKRTDDELVVYDQIATPVVSDRDVTLRMYKVVRPDAFEMRFESTDAYGPPPDPKYVRLPVVRGAWTIVAVPGGTRLTYVCYAEPGGSIPAFMVRGAQKDQIPIDVERVLSHLRGG